MISHTECSVTEEVELITSTQYVMSGSTPDISRVKGGSQVRERVEFEAVMFSEPTAERRPIIDQEQHKLRCSPPKLTLQ